MKDFIVFRKGYKYQLANYYSIKTSVTGFELNTEFISLSIEGLLVIKQGYAYDGPSGITFDTKNFMRGSLVHDALYQLMRQVLLPQGYKKYADELLKNICIKDGMSKIRAFYVYQAVKYFGKSSTDPKNKKQIIKAP